MNHQAMEAEIFYYQIIQKLNTTLVAYNHIPEVSQCGESFESLEVALYSKDAQVNHLLSITMCLLKHVPNSPFLDEIFTNFLKDYIHLVNPEMPKHIGELYLTDEFVKKQSQEIKIKFSQKSPVLKVQGVCS